MHPIFIITGPPAVGKSTVSRALLDRFDFGFHIPVDDLREWVTSGISHPVGWTDETSRQFKLAESAAADLAIRYQDAGFAVAIDHCQGPPTLVELASTRFSGRPVKLIALVCDLETNHRRNIERTNKAFDASVLTETIDRLNPLYRTSGPELEGWLVVDNSDVGISRCIDAILQSSPESA
jgi:chloramphenicol 3-O-phosphotransferase